jgi:hypothetical protein
MRVPLPLLASLGLLPATVSAQVALSPPTAYNAGAIPEALAAQDLDRDGDVDLTVVDRQGHLRLLLNDGRGCFDRAIHHERLWRTTSDGVWPHFPSMIDVAVDDVTGDGTPDVVATYGEMQGMVSVLPGLGGARFGPAANHAACSYAKNVAIGELDGQPGADLAVTSNCFKATVLHNDGGGRFTVGDSFGTGYTSGAIAAADLDGDGDTDLGFVNIGISNVTLLFNDGNGRYSRVEGQGTGDNPWDIVFADLDGDGDADLATANVYSGDVTVRWNDGGTFARSAAFAAGTSPRALAAGDLSGDGLADLAVADATGRLAVLRNLRGAFAAPLLLAAGQAPKDVALADYDGNGRLDVAVLNQLDETVGIHLGGAPRCANPAPWPVNDVIVPLATHATTWNRRRMVFLGWGTDIRSATVQIYRNGKRLKVEDRGAYFWDDVTRAAGRQFRYRVCETGRFTSCSAEVTATF